MFSPSILGLNLWQIKGLKTVLDGFVGIVNESNGQPNKLWVDQGR